VWGEDTGSLPWLWREPGYLGQGAATPLTDQQGASTFLTSSHDSCSSMHGSDELDRSICLTPAYYTDDLIHASTYV